MDRGHCGTVGENVGGRSRLLARTMMRAWDDGEATKAMGCMYIVLSVSAGRGCK